MLTWLINLLILATVNFVCFFLVLASVVQKKKKLCKYARKHATLSETSRLNLVICVVKERGFKSETRMPKWKFSSIVLYSAQSLRRKACFEIPHPAGFVCKVFPQSPITGGTGIKWLIVSFEKPCPWATSITNQKSEKFPWTAMIFKFLHSAQVSAPAVSSRR